MFGSVACGVCSVYYRKCAAMSVGDVVVIAALAACVIIAVILSVRNKGKCSGDCSCCGMACKNNIDKE